MNRVADVLQGTPAWAYALFALLFWLGSRRFKASTIPVGRLWIAPCAFIAWGLVALVQRGGEIDNVALHWLFAAALGAIGGALPRMVVQIDRGRSLVRLPGSVTPLLRYLALFAAHYALNVAAALQPQMHDRFMQWDLYVSAVGAGYFIGWALRFAQVYRRAPHTELRRSDAAPSASPMAKSASITPTASG